MNLEETKKIIQNKIEAESLTKNVRSQIKSYIDQKQNAREGFKETFQPLIESQEKTKESIDNQQNKLIKQLQENQLALTEGLDKNRLAITQGFDKMEEVRRWDFDQLPGIGAIEELEKDFGQEQPVYSISINDMKLLLGGEESDFTQEDENLMNIRKEDLDLILSQNKLNNDKYELKLIDPEKGILKVVKKNYSEEAKKGVVTFDDSDLDKGLLSRKSVDILKKLKLQLPSKIKNEKLEVIKIYQRNAEIHLEYFRDLLPNKAILLHRKRSK